MVLWLACMSLVMVAPVRWFILFLRLVADPMNEL